MSGGIRAVYCRGCWEGMGPGAAGAYSCLWKRRLMERRLNMLKMRAEACWRNWRPALIRLEKKLEMDSRIRLIGLWRRCCCWW